MNWIRKRGRTFWFYLVVVVCLLLLGVLVAIAIGASGLWQNFANMSWRNYLTKPELELVLKVATILISFAALWVAAVRAWAAIYPIYLQRRNQRMLEDKFSRGPYDKATIERSARYYIRPQCSNIDAAQERELRHALIATREDLFDKVDYFLDHDDSHRHLLVLADSGTGKTSFVLNYYAHNSRRPKRNRHRLALVPLGVKNADQLIANIPNQEDTALFLDAFDEDTKAIADHHSRIRALMESCHNFKRVVITCRTQFFPRDEEIPIETGIARLGALRAGERSVYEFWKLYLSPFDDDEVDQYLKKRYPIWHRRLRKKARAIALKIPLLTARPMLLAHIPDVINSGAEILFAYELYGVMIDAWLERETAWVNKEALREFSEQLAVNIYLNREARGMERIPREELPELAEAWGIDIPPWKLTTRSLLNRDAEGNYKFAHRSIMEYLFAVRLVNGDERCYRVVLTDQMKHFLIEMLSANSPELEPFRDLLLGLELSAEGTSQYTEMASIHMAIDPPLRVLLMQIAGDLQKEVYSVEKELTRGEKQVPLSPEQHMRIIAWVALKSGTEELIGRLRVGDNELPSSLLDNQYSRSAVLRNLPKGLHPLLYLIRRDGLALWYSIYALNQSTNLRLEPTSSDVDQFVLKFILSQKTSKTQR